MPIGRTVRNSIAPIELIRDWKNEMAFVPFLNTVRVAMEFTQSGQVLVNVYHVSKSSPIITADMTAIAGIFRDWWIGTQRQYHNVNMGLTNVSVVNLTTQFSPGIELPVVPTSAGTVAGDALPLNCALVVEKITALRGRPYRGRVYLGGFTESDQSGSIWGASLVTNCVASLQSLEDEIELGGYEMVVASRQENNVVRTNGVVTAITGFTANNVVDSQRRRLPGRGI